MTQPATVTKKKFEVPLNAANVADVRDILDLMLAALDTPMVVTTVGDRQALSLVEQVTPYLRQARKIVDEPIEDRISQSR